MFALNLILLAACAVLFLIGVVALIAIAISIVSSVQMTKEMNLSAKEWE